LPGADLTGADLHRARLSNADLTGAQLHGANLADANLARAHLVRADLGSTRLNRTLLMRANLTGAYLGDANLTSAVLFETVFANVDLSRCEGLAACAHDGPSTVDIRTLERSGPLPLSFLRGVGLPDSLIEYLPTLRKLPTKFYSCFISYSSQDEEFAYRIHADLQTKGVRCWFAPHDMRTGDKIRTRIDEVIRTHQKLLLVLSENAIASGWVEKEVETAFEQEQDTRANVLFPVRLDGSIMKEKTGWAADIRRSRHIGDFTGWKEHDIYNKSFERLLRDLKVDAD
jgi:hypothetical protein